MFISQTYLKYSKVKNFDIWKLLLNNPRSKQITEHTDRQEKVLRNCLLRNNMEAVLQIMYGFVEA